MSQATTACDSWQSDVRRLTKEVAENSTKRKAGGDSLHYSSVRPPPSGIDYSHPFTPTDKVDSPFQPLRSAEGSPWEHVPSTSTALSDMRSVTDDSTSKRKDAENFELEPWPQASKNQFYEGLFPQRSYNRIKSSSIQQRLVGRTWFGIYYGRI